MYTIDTQLCINWFENQILFLIKLLFYKITNESSKHLLSPWKCFTFGNVPLKGLGGVWRKILHKIIKVLFLNKNKILKRVYVL